MTGLVSRLGEILKRTATIVPDLLFWPRLQFGPRGKRILIAVHEYAPRISGAGVHAQWIAEALQAKGYDCWVYAARTAAEPRRVNGIPIITEPRMARYFDVVFTYSAVYPQQCLARHMARLRNRPRWLHYPCACASGDMLRGCDLVVAMNPKDVTLAIDVCGSADKVRRVRVGVHESRIGPSGEFKRKYGIESDFLLWVGAWLPAKGVRNLSDRFLRFRKLHPGKDLKLVMFSGYGGREYPAKDKDIVVVDRNSDDVPAALNECLCVVFNSPPAPVGFDANPLILVEAMMNRKTFIAQAGTPLLEDIKHLGIVVETDDDWLEAVRTVAFDADRRRQLEASCFRAYRETYNMSAMMEDVERAIREVL
jgi:glycosyltransferase involved in cell wall biosynthesis